MYIADMHCDTISELYDRRKRGNQAELYRNNLQIDIEKMRKSNYLVQNFAVFADLGKEENPYRCAKNQIALFEEELRRNRDVIRQARTAAELEQNRRDGRISALLTLEEGEICEGNLSKLEEFYEAGVRMMTFTWNYRNSLGTPASELFLSSADSDSDRRAERIGARYSGEENSRGLSELGIAFLEKMDALGILADVSHLSEEGFYDICRYAKKPFVASHSNARALCGHKRNLTDDMIRKIAEMGGVVGVNYYGRFLDDKTESGIYFSRISRIADHVLHMIRVGGIACVGLGSDFDGIDDNLELSDCSKMERLWEELKKRGLSEDEREAVCFRNVWNLYQEAFS